MATKGSLAGGGAATNFPATDPSLVFIPGTSFLNRRWLHIDEHGQPRTVEVDKHRLVQELRIRYRDLMSIDPSVPTPYPSSLFIRERALVVNLETVRMIVCANQCYVLSVPKEADPRMATQPTPGNPFVQALCRMLRGASPQKSTANLHQPSTPSFDYSMPFELRALECALSTASRMLDDEVLELEREAYPAIDRLAVSVSRRVLEEVRASKATMNRLIGRVQRIKQELEEVLADDADMQDMYLGRRAQLEGKELPAQPPDSPRPGRPYKSYSNLLALQGEEEGGGPKGEAFPPPLPHSPSAAAVLSRHNGGGGAPAGSAARPASLRGMAAAGAAGSGAGAESSSRRGWEAHGEERQQLERSASGRNLARQAQRRHTAEKAPLPAREDIAGGRAGGSSIFRQSSLVVRTVRRLRGGRGKGRRRHSQERPAARSPRAAAEAGGGGPPSSSGSSEAGSEAGSERGEGSVHIGGRGGGAGSDSEDERGSVIEETVMEHPTALVDPHDIEEAEDLLESYFMMVDYLLRRLMLLHERIDDTEDLVNIEMDHRRNELVALDLLVTCFAAAFTFVAMVAGIFGMNLYNASWVDSETVFIWIMVVMCLCAVLLLTLILVYIRKRRLMFISSLP